MSYLSLMALHEDSSGTKTDLTEILDTSADQAIQTVAGKGSVILKNISSYVDAFTIGDSLSVYAKNGRFVDRGDLDNFSSNNSDDVLIVGDISDLNPVDSAGAKSIGLEVTSRSEILNLILVFGQTFNESDGRRVSVSGGDEDNSLVHLLVAQLNQQANLTGAAAITLTADSIDTSDFPDGLTGVEYTASFKPAGEVLKDWGAGSYTSGQRFYFFIDSDNVFHWKLISTSPVDGTITYGTDDIFNLNFSKKVFGVFNAAIYNAGSDFNGEAITYYAVNYRGVTDSGGFRWTYIPDLNISRQIKLSNGVTIDNEFPNGNPAEYSGGNAKFRTDIRALGRSQVEAILEATSIPRWKGGASFHGTNTYSIGGLYNFVIPQYGWTAAAPQVLRIEDTQHTIGSDGWFTTLNVREETEAGI